MARYRKMVECRQYQGDLQGLENMLAFGLSGMELIGNVLIVNKPDSGGVRCYAMLGRFEIRDLHSDEDMEH